MQDAQIVEKYNACPAHIREKLLFLRKLVFETASEINDAIDVKEALKWGEPSFLTQTGSTLRLDWKPSRPDQYAMYFNCKTKLVDTFKELYGEVFKFEGNHAIVFDENDIIPVVELKHCIALSLTYHRIKHLPLLGVWPTGKEIDKTLALKAMPK